MRRPIRDDRLHKMEGAAYHHLPDSSTLAVRKHALAADLRTFVNLARLTWLGEILTLLRIGRVTANHLLIMHTPGRRTRRRSRRWHCGRRRIVRRRRIISVGRISCRRSRWGGWRWLRLLPLFWRRRTWWGRTSSSTRRLPLPLHSRLALLPRGIRHSLRLGCGRGRCGPLGEHGHSLALQYHRASGLQHGGRVRQHLNRSGAAMKPVCSSQR